MKYIINLLAVFVFSISAFAQSPDKLSYQAVIRNTNGTLILNQGVGIRISILQGSATGTPVYIETHSPTTNANGLTTVEIGGGTVVSGTFAEINWSNGLYFIKTETDPIGGTNYSITSTSQILSVPYALYSKTSETSADAVKLTGDQSISGRKTFTGTINASNKVISNVAAPVSANDAANKYYVDALKKQIIVLEDNLISTGTYKLIDVEGNKYDVVKIGIQIWMAENLKVTHYNNGDSMPTIYGSEEPFYYYDKSIPNAELYGCLYNYYAVRTNRLCPVGWHIPTYSDWKELITYLGGNDIAGGKLKATGTLEEGNGLWKNPNTGATNESGFTALPGVYYFLQFNGIGTSAYWWSYTNYQGVSPAGDYNASMFQINFDNTSITNAIFDRTYMLSVRCIKTPPLPSVYLNGFTLSDLHTSATISYVINDDIGLPVIERGICYNTNHFENEICEYKTNDGSGIGSFTGTVNNLDPNWGYWIRAYATTIMGTAYSEPAFMQLNY